MSLLEIEGLEVGRDGHGVLHGVDLRLDRGEVLGLVGANGSGKTSLLHCIAGLLEPAAGTVRLAGAIVHDDLERARRRLGCSVPAALLPGPLTGWQCLELFAAAHGLSRLPDDTFEVAEALRLEAMLGARIERYSYGMRQKLIACLVLLGEPDLLLLDESFNGLDLLAAHALREILAERCARRQCAVILATHQLDITQSCMTRVALLDGGRLLRQWTAEALQQRAGGLEQALLAALREPG